MRKTILMMMVGVVVLLACIPALNAQTLPVDTRKKEMQFFRDYDWIEVAPADTVWAGITLPKGTMAVHIMSLADSVAVARDPLYSTATSMASGAPGLIISSFRQPVWLPTWKKTKIWVRRASADVAGKVRLIFYTM